MSNEHDRIEILPGGTPDGKGGRGRVATPEELGEYLRDSFSKFVVPKRPMIDLGHNEAGHFRMVAPGECEQFGKEAGERFRSLMEGANKQ